MQTSYPIRQDSFLSWSRKQSRYIIFYIIIIIAEFVWSKYYYPYPNFFTDSNSYIGAAHDNQFINMWPIGYSWVIKGLGYISHSDNFLVTFQYLLLHFSQLYFLGTIIYFFRPGKRVIILMSIFALVNPLMAYLANFVSSDAIYTALSIIWMTQLLWILYKPGKWLVYGHAILLLITFTIRYNALYYPIISIFVILWSSSHKREKLISISLIILLLGGFIGRTMYEYKRQTGALQFTGFGGWQVATNALFAYVHADTIPVKQVPARFKELHWYVNQHMKAIAGSPYKPEIGIFYLWDGQSPLQQYRQAKGKPLSPKYNYFQQWASFSPLYGAYGSYLISQRPGAYLSDYIIPNSYRYWLPPGEFLESYNMGRDTVEPMEVQWFRYTSKNVKTRTANKDINILKIYIYLQLLFNLFYLQGFIGFLAVGGYKNSSPYFKKAVWLIFFVWFANLAFSVLASPLVLRYQLFSLTVTITLGLLFMEYVIHVWKESD